MGEISDYCPAEGLTHNKWWARQSRGLPEFTMRSREILLGSLMRWWASNGEGKVQINKLTWQGWKSGGMVTIHSWQYHIIIINKCIWNFIIIYYFTTLWSGTEPKEINSSGSSSKVNLDRQLTLNCPAVESSLRLGYAGLIHFWFQLLESD